MHVLCVMQLHVATIAIPGRYSCTGKFYRYTRLYYNTSKRGTSTTEALRISRIWGENVKFFGLCLENDQILSEI